VFLAELDKIGVSEKENVMEVVTSWMQDGIERGQRQSIEALLVAKYGELTPELAELIPALMALEPINRARLILQSSQAELFAQFQC
jgi:hypothetical protein